MAPCAASPSLLGKNPRFCKEHHSATHQALIAQLHPPLTPPDPSLPRACETTPHTDAIWMVRRRKKVHWMAKLTIDTFSSVPPIQSDRAGLDTDPIDNQRGSVDRTLETHGQQLRLSCSRCGFHNPSLVMERMAQYASPKHGASFLLKKQTIW